MIRAIENLSGLELFAGSIATVMAIWAVGAIANAVLKDLGFGTALNGVLLFCGMLSGALVRSLTLGFQ